MYNERRSGILLHLTSLPGRWGMGELGPAARAFAATLAEAGQRIWQILPVGPVGYGFSPYSSLSAFAGNHLLISFDDLIDEGLLTHRHLARFPSFDPHRIDFPAVIEAREKILFRLADRLEPGPDFAAFKEREAAWLDDYALFMAIRESLGNRNWTAWPEGLRDRDPHELAEARIRLAKPIRRHEILQYLFDRHWRKTTDEVHRLGISWIGDLPIFVADDSVDVWAHRSLFFLHGDGRPRVVAGVPPDYFSETGQRWGNPLYNWPLHRETGYAWWTQRFRRLFQLTDAVRIDHFRGFEAYWEIPATEPNAVRGRWVNGPGLDLFQAVERNLRQDGAGGKSEPFRLADHVIAENLGIITDEVEALREDCGFPGMWVLQFRFGAMDWHRPGFVPEGTEVNQAVYTGTHDNDTVRGWFDRLPQELPPGAAGEFDFERRRILEYLGTGGEAIHRDFIRLAMRSPACLAITPLQDLLGLGSEARMNTPSTVSGNWGWRFSEEMINKETIQWMLDTTRVHGR